MTESPVDVAVISVSHNAGYDLPRSLVSFAPALETLRSRTIVVDNGSDGAGDLVADALPDARVFRCDNRGFAHACNLGARAVEARYLLFVNPDTEWVDGDVSSLVAACEALPRVGVVGVRQVRADGRQWETIRRYPTPLRTAAEGLGLGALGRAGQRWTETVTDPGAYLAATRCDWVAGSFMLVRAEAFRAVDGFDERFFLYSEEADLCLRMSNAGWEIRYSPELTIRHKGAPYGTDPVTEARLVVARRQYAAKHFTQRGGVVARAGLVAHYALRVAWAALKRDRLKRVAMQAGFQAAVRRADPFDSTVSRSRGS
jgi:N-acetylglucosaminyl-diphospho-decaprenol L-rhamnosyltransferase